MASSLNVVVFLLCFIVSVAAYPGGKLIHAPPKQVYTGIKRIPGKNNPYKAPGPHDLRGPCPGLNTLANHGYIPRNGIATFEEIVNAVGEGFNMEYTLASALTAFGMLARGNAYTNQISIGGPTGKIPPLPGNIDGNSTKGLATHGRFEGDVSMTRRDFAVGDNVHLDPALFSQFLDYVAKYGNDSDVTGPKSVVSYKAMQEFKYARYLDSIAEDPVLVYHFGRFILSYGEASFTLNFFANGTDGVLSTSTLKSIFQNQRFPLNWHRRGTPGDINLIGDGVENVLSAHEDAVPGINANGTFIPDPLPTTGCALYQDLGVNNVPAVLVNTTGILKKNVDFLLKSIHNLFAPQCNFTLPAGESGV
ncbi:Chloroperoxidase [Flagelloscypha sp. PMI_526]|nr:Chloroperoxidase [Flagelloscypha sp. PMI_526]